MSGLRREDERSRRKRVALLITGIALTLIILDISGVARTASKTPQGTGGSITTTSTVYVTRSVTSREAEVGSATDIQATTPTTSHTSSNAIFYTFTQTRSTSLVTPTVNRLEDWMLFVSLDPQPSFTASGIWRINETAVGVLLILVANFSAHQVPYRTILNLTITGPEIDQTIHQEELPLNGRIETRTTAYELTFNKVNPPPHARYLVTIYFQREDGKELKAQGWDTLNDQLYQDIQLTLQDNPPWEG